MKQTYIIALFCLVITVFFSEGMLNAQVDPYPNIEIPVMKGAYKVKCFFDRPKQTKSLNYYVKVGYPAEEVFRFYDSRFKDNGWTTYNDKMKGQWECFVDGTMESTPQVRQFLTSWVSPEFREEAFLALKYVKVGDEWSDELHVICQIQPLTDRTMLEEFLKQLDESGHLSSFMELIDSYRMANGEVDVDKAIKENPDNDHLKEYKKIVHGHP